MRRVQAQRNIASAMRLPAAGALAFGFALLLSGCARFSPDGGMDVVGGLAGSDLDKEVVALRTPEDAAAARAKVERLLKRPLSADTAVQIALINNRVRSSQAKEAAMTRRTLVTAATVALWLGASVLVVQAQSDDFVNGQVTKIDESAGKITIKHGPLKKFGMEDGMTMVFRAGDPAMLKAVKPGNRIRFVPDRVNGQFTVKRIEKAK